MDWTAKEYQSYLARFCSIVNQSLLKKDVSVAAATLAAAELLSQQIQELSETMGKCSELLEGVQDILHDANAINPQKRLSSSTKLERPTDRPADLDACV